MTNEPHDHAGRGWYGGPDEYGDGRTAQPYGWGGEPDADATAFVQLPPGGLPGGGPDPLAAPGTGQGGWEPPPIDPAADAGTQPGTPMTPAAGLDPASTGQWTMPFAAQPPHPAQQPQPEEPGRPAEPDGGAGGAMSRGPAAALGQGAAAALAGSHEARTHRRPLGAGGAAAAGEAGPVGPVEETQHGGGAQHGGAPEEWPQPAPSASWRADQEAMLADALARRQVPLPGSGVPQQAPGWDDARAEGSAGPWRAEDGAGHTWDSGTPQAAGPDGPVGDGSWAAAPWAPDENGPGHDQGTPAHGFPAADGAATTVPEQGPGWHDAPGDPLVTDQAAGHGPAPYPQQAGPAEHQGAQGGTFPSVPEAGNSRDDADLPHPADTPAAEATDEGTHAAGPQPAPEPPAGGGDAPATDAAAEDGPSAPPEEAAEHRAAGPGSAAPEPAEPAPEERGAATTPEPVPDPAPAAETPAEAPAEVPAVETPAEAPATVSDHPHISYLLHVNGADRPVSDAWIGESLLYVLRERLGLAGAKDGCSQGECGACSVQMDGRLVAACLVPAATAVGTDIRTVEGLAGDDGPSDVQRALADSGAVQCGFCVPGIAMAVHDLLEGNHAPTELETRQALCGNLCRCSGYRGVLDAVQQVAGERADRAAREAARAEAEEAAQRAGHTPAGGTPATGAGGAYADGPHIPQQAQYGGGEGVR